MSPLPSFVVLVPVGAAADVQGYGVWYLLVLALCTGIGRLPAALLLYLAADKFEDAILRRRRLFGLSHKEVERFGKRLGKSGRRDWWLLFMMNGIPLFPTMVLSLACGFVKVPRRMFITATFLGSMLNGLFYVSIGYAGLRVAETLSGLELAGQIVGGLLLIAAIGWVVYRRQQTRRPKRK